MNWKNRLDLMFVSYSQLSIRHPLICLLIPLLLLVGLTIEMTKLKQDTTFESFFEPDSELFLKFQNFRHIFGRDEFVLVMVETDDMYQTEFLEGLVNFHQQLELITSVDKVDSLVNARFIRAEDDELVISDLLETIPRSATELAALKQNIQDNPVYHRRLISDDQKFIAVMASAIPYHMVADKNGNQKTVDVTPEELAVMLDDIKQVAAEHGAFAKRIRFAGAASVAIEMNKAINRDFMVFTSASILLIIIFLTIMFRRFSGVAMPLTVILSGLIATLGFMSLLNYPVQITTSILPSFLLAVCVGGSVHMLSYFYQEFDAGADKAQALLASLHHAAVPMMFTSFTTAAGLMSFSFVDLVPVASLGTFGAIGALVAFVSTIALLPPLIVLFPIATKKVGSAESKKNHHNDALQRFLNFLVNLAMDYPKVIVSFCIALFCAGIWATSQLPFSNNSLKWFGPEVEARQAIEASEKVFAGSSPIEILIDTGVNGGALDPILWMELDKWLTKLNESEINGVYIGSVTSLADLIKETNRSMHNNELAYYRIPESRELLAQELLMIELDKAEELYSFMDNDKRLVRITLIHPWMDSLQYEGILEEIEKQYRAETSNNYKISFTGMNTIVGVFFSDLIEAMANSYALAGIVITVMMILLLGDIKLGLISMIPNLIPIITLMGLMWVFDFALDMFTMLIGSIAIGLSVDDTIHFMHGFRKNLEKHNDAHKAVEATILTTGRALLITSLVLCCGFLTYALSSLTNLFDFGILTATCTILALFADLLLAPALMILVYGDRKQSTVDKLDITKKKASTEGEPEIIGTSATI